ncbi:MAG TPA: aconitase X, partial [Burkholderiales bacterium]|nr:aconitase X [Burkholderiales bacterium]
MKLNDLERSMLAGEHGAAAKRALEHQIKVGEFFGAADFVPVTQAHVMADTESLGEPGIAWLEALGRDHGRVRVPTITDPRGTDFAKASVLGHPARIVELERRLIEAFKKLGVLMTDTCINYQTIQAPARGESVAFGDTGVVIYANSVCGARSNYEGGPSAVAAGLTARTPRYGFHLDEHRRATVKIRTQFVPKTL